MYLAIGYLMVSWRPHLNLHAANGVDFRGLLIIDYLFHLPLEVTAMVLAYCAFSIFRSWRSGKLAETMSDDAAQ